MTDFLQTTADPNRPPEVTLLRRPALNTLVHVFCHMLVHV